MANKNSKEARAAAEEAEVVADVPEGPENPEEPAGVPEGTQLDTTQADGTQSTETVVHDLDEEGNVAGWHKE